MSKTDAGSRTSPESRRKQLLLGIHDLAQQETRAIEANDWQGLAKLRAAKRADMAQVDRISAQIGAPGPESREIIEKIALLARANTAQMRSKADAMKKSLDEIPESRRRLTTLRNGYAKMEQRAICLDKSV